jgi:hypothetical protein
MLPVRPFPSSHPVCACVVLCIKCEFELIECEFELIECEFELIECEFELIECEFELIECEFEFIECEFEFIKSICNQTMTHHLSGKTLTRPFTVSSLTLVI